MSEENTEFLAMPAHLDIWGEKKITPGVSEIARKCGAEGMILLENNGVLPLRENEKIAVFGRCQVDTLMVGYGSGGDIHPPYQVNILDGLRNSKRVTVDETLAKEYETWCRKAENAADPGTVWAWWPFSYPEMPLEESRIEEAAKGSDIALYVIGRAAGEDRESQLTAGSYYLTEQEKEQISLVRKHFRHVVLILNCGNIIDMEWSREAGCDAVVLMWLAGMEGGNALADILTGKETPSGKLAATIAESYEDYPSSSNFGDPEQNVYEEDIYVGYRYFETFAPGKIRYSFGYGLSYTTFETTVNKAERTKDGFSCQVTVRNTGERAGKEVVQLYLSAPQGKLGKEYKRLVAFQKTGKLAPGEEERILLTTDRKWLASYDDLGKTGHKSAWVMEEGTYQFTLGTSGKDGRLCYIPAGSFVQETLEVTEQLEPICSLQQPISRLTTGTDNQGEQRKEEVPAGTVDLKGRILNGLPKELPYTGDKGIRFEDVCAGRADMDEFIAQLDEEELQSLTRGEGGLERPRGIEGNQGIFGGFLASVEEKGVPLAVTDDGPAGLRICRYTSLFPCGTLLACSFAPELTEELYGKAAEEMERFGIDVMLAPGMNIQRNPLCGRNFEYYSEDPYVAGKMGSAAVRGIQSRGRSACPKHFACNNQETRRYFNNSILSERALREIYFPAFRTCIAEGKPKTLMMSYNKINGVWSHYNYDLATTVLRKEWKYSGMVVTDWWMRRAPSPEFPGVRDNAYRVRAQVDVLMPGNEDAQDPVKDYHPDGTLLESLGKEGGITRDEIHRSVRNVLNFCKQIKGYKDGLGSRMDQTET